jgi:hypothetical protein
MGNEAGSRICNPSRAAQLYSSTPTGLLFGKPINMFVDGYPVFLPSTCQYIATNASNFSAVEGEAADNAKQLADVIRQMLDDGTMHHIRQCPPSLPLTAPRCPSLPLAAPRCR